MVPRRRCLAPRLGWIGAITLAGACFRFFLLDRYPTGFYFDEAANAFDISALGRNFHPLYFTANNGREPLFFYWAAMFMHALAATPFSLRVAAAFLGVATVPAVYFCFAQVLWKSRGPRQARRVALFAAAICAFLFFHLIFSRLGLRTIALPLFECLAFGLLWQAGRRRSPWRFVAGGFCLGLCLYTYTAARLLIAGLAIYAVYALLRRRSIDWRGWAIAAGAFVVTALPLGIYGVTHTAQFLQRTEGVAVTERGAVVHGLLAVFGMFVLRGTNEGTQNIPGMPVFDPWMAALFLLGLLLCLWRLREPAYVFVLIWLLSIVPASAFSPSPPYYLRLTGLIPPMVLLPALALAELPDWLARLSKLALGSWRYVPSGVLVLATAGMTFYHYFGVWAPSRAAYYAMMQDKVDAVSVLDRWQGDGDRVFLAPLYAQDWTFRWLTSGQPIQSFEAKSCTVLPPRGTAATYVYPYFDKEQPPALLAHLPGHPTVEQAPNSRGEPMLTAIHEPGADLPAPAAKLLGSFGGKVGLVRVEGLPGQAVRPGSAVNLTLVWQALRTMDADYSVFVHADDHGHQRRIQRDSMPCANSFLTSRWTPGEQVQDYYTLAVPADAPDGTYTVTTGLYKLPELRNLTVDGASNTTQLEVGSFAVAREG